MSKGVRVGVPLNIICSMKWVNPAWSGSSSREPTLNHRPSETDLTCGIVSLTMVIPFDNTDVSMDIVLHSSCCILLYESDCSRARAN